MSSAQLSAQLQPRVARAVQGIGLELEELQVSPAGRRRLVRVVVDTVESAGDERIDLDLDAVASVSRAVSAALDECDDVLGGPYTLEVTSPGLDRPLTTPRHWRRARRRLVKVRHCAGDELVGRVGDAGDEGVTLLVDGALRRVRYDELDRAVVQVEFREPPAEELRALDGDVSEDVPETPKEERT